MFCLSKWLSKSENIKKEQLQYTSNYQQDNNKYAY